MENKEQLLDLASELYKSCEYWMNKADSAIDNDEAERYESIRFNVAVAYRNVRDAVDLLHLGRVHDPVQINYRRTYESR